MKGNTKVTYPQMCFELCMVCIPLPECQRSNLKASDLLKQKGLYMSILAVLCPRWKLQDLHFSLLKMWELPKSLCELITLWGTRIESFLSKHFGRDALFFQTYAFYVKQKLMCKQLHTSLLSLKFSAGTPVLAFSPDSPPLDDVQWD